MTTLVQNKQNEWHYEWAHFEDDEAFLFFDWIYPRTLNDLRGQRILDAGCGPGHHVRLIAPIAKEVVAMDLNTADIASQKLAHFNNVSVVDADIAQYVTDQPFDVIYSIGVIDHTNSPDKTFGNLKSLCKGGGLMIVWVYSHEGNQLLWRFVEPLRQKFLARRSRKTVNLITRIITALMYPIVYTVYQLPLTFLPFYEYFKNFRRLSFERNVLNNFDKLNAPQTEFIPRSQIERWFNPNDFEDVSITQYKGVSWRASGRLKTTEQ